MQIILVSRHLKAARTITIMPRHLAAVALSFFGLVLAMAMLLTWLSVYWRLPLVEDFMLSLHMQEQRKSQQYLQNNLALMAGRLGELQAKSLQLDSLGQHLRELTGGARALPVEKKGAGGAFVPDPLNFETLDQEMKRLGSLLDRQSDELRVLESRLLEKRVRDRLLPTALPVQGASFGSPFGHRSDPIAGLRAMHEGIDFNAPVGTPVRAAADGVVFSANYHPEFGNLIEVDHGQGLLSRYAHLAAMSVQAGSLIRRGQLLGAVGMTGRTTGPHLHFEVRQDGVAQNPAVFLRQDAAFAQLKSR